MIGAEEATPHCTVDRSAHMTTGFTLRGFYILDDYAGPTVNFHNNSGTLNIEDLEIQNVNQDGIGLQVTNQTGAVNLWAVNATGNGAQGADLTVTGAVTITNSAFDANGDSGGTTNGLIVKASGAVTLNGVSARTTPAARVRRSLHRPV